MNDSTYAIEVSNLYRSFGDTEAVRDLNLRVPRGSCFGFFGRNGAGKTTTIKCLLNLLRPHKGGIGVFGMDPAKNEEGVKSRLTYVPEQVAFYPWMSVREILDYTASFRDLWNREIEADLLERFDLDPNKKVASLSRGMKAQLSLLCAVCPQPDLLLLDEPTSGLDPIVRREFIRTVIGAFQEGDPENRTVFVSTHLIAEFEGLIDEFTVIDRGKDILTLEAETAREKFRKIMLRFPGEPPEIEGPGILSKTREGREVEIVTGNRSDKLMERLSSLSPESMKEEPLSLEEIFIAAASLKGGGK